MKKTKFIISFLFILLIITEILYSMWQTSLITDNISIGLAIAMEPLLLSIFIIPELEIWHFILYLISWKKNNRTYKKFFNITSFILTIGIIFSELQMFSFFTIISDFKLQEIICFVTFGIYLIIKFIHFIVWAENEE